MFFFIFEKVESEVWKDIPGYEGLYQCSNFGRVKSLERIIVFGRQHCSQKVIPEKILVGKIGQRGYIKITLCGNPQGRLKYVNVHTVVARTFYGDYASHLVVNHIDGNKQNNKITNLEIVTQKENVLHAMNTGLRNIFGEDNGRASLTNNDAKHIRNMYISGVSRKEIAERCGVPKYIVNAVIRNKTYKDENYQYKEGQGHFTEGA